MGKPTLISKKIKIAALLRVCDTEQEAADIKGQLTCKNSIAKEKAFHGFAYAPLL